MKGTMTANNGPKEKAEEAATKYAKKLLNDLCFVPETSEQERRYAERKYRFKHGYLAGYRAALEWVLQHATEVAEKYKSQNFGMPLIPVNTLKSMIKKELGDE